MDEKGIELDDVANLLNDLAILQVVALRQGFASNSELIVALSEAGFENSRIAGLVGTSTPTVRSAVNRAKEKKE